MNLNDTLIEAHKFGEGVADALNRAQFAPPFKANKKRGFGVLTVVGIEPNRPIGGSINWNARKKRWEFGIQLSEGEPCDTQQ